MNNNWFLKALSSVSLAGVVAMGIWVGTINTKVEANEEAAKKIEKIKEDIAKIDERTKIILEELQRQRR